MLSNHPSVLGSGPASVTTPAATSAALDLISTTQGAVLYRNASAWVALTPGTSGQLLSTQGAAANPIWVTATGGAGDFNGPASATDNAIVRFDGTGGKTGQNSAITVSDAAAGNVTLGAITTTDLTLSGGSSGASLVLGQGATAGLVTLTPTGTGYVRTQNGYWSSTATPLTAGYGLNASGVSYLGIQSALISGTKSAIALGYTATPLGAITPIAHFVETGNLLIGTTTDIPGTASLKVAGTTAATNTTSGSLQNAGGFGNAGAIYAGGLIKTTFSTTGSLALWATNTHSGGYGAYIAGGSTATSTQYLLQLSDYTESAKYQFYSDAAKFLATSPSTSSTTGALQVAGGIYAGAASVFGGTVTSLPASAAQQRFSAQSFSENYSAGYEIVSAFNGGTPTAAGFLFYPSAYTGNNVFGEAVSAPQSVMYQGNSTGSLKLGTTQAGADVRVYQGSTLALTIGTAGAATFAGAVVTTSATLSGAGAIPITTSLVKFTSTGAANALTLANGVDGQRLTIVHDVKGTLGTGVLTPTTKTGFSTVTFTNAGDTVDLVYVTTRGWMVVGSYLATIAP